MDVRKAFDVLWHLGLLREMNKAGFEGDNWRFFENWYTDLTSKIKWNELLSHKIVEKQGLRQGGIWTPSAYKLYVNSLLDIFEENQIGMHIGPIFCGIPRVHVADDVTLISNDPRELQTMLDIQSHHSNKLAEISYFGIQ
jgi:hypothetical protein